MFVILLLIGLGAGVLAGLFGVGGGIIFTPVLFILFSGSGVADPVTWTVGSSLFCTFAAALSSTVQQSRGKNLFYQQGVMVGVFGAFGVYAGKQVVISSFYTETLFVLLFICLLLFVSVILLLRNRASESGNEIGTYSDTSLGWGKTLFTGGCGGFVAALAGVGGGIVMVPIMNLLYRLDMRRSVSVSSLAIVIISFSGWLQFAIIPTESTGLTQWAVGHVDFGSALPLLAGAVLGGALGVRVNHRLSNKMIQTGFLLLILTVMAIMITRLF